MKNKRGFTLIELLVVIAIIALLMAVILPALQIAKRKAMEVSSMSNMRSLAVIWVLYADEHNGKLVGGQVHWDTQKNINGPYEQPTGWRDRDWVRGINPTEPGTDHERELAGIKRGALWPYVENEDVYHSPGDRTWMNAQTPYTEYQSPFRSYAISDAMSGCFRPDYCYHSTGEIKNPGGRMVFTEEEDQNGANWGSWVLGTPGTNNWWDPLAAWYNKSSATIFGFADGHADKHVWQEQGTKDWIKTQNLGYAPSPDELDDISYMHQAYHHKY